MRSVIGGGCNVAAYVYYHSFSLSQVKSAAVTTKMRLSNHLLCFHLQDMEFGMAIRKSNAERPRFRGRSCPRQTHCFTLWSSPATLTSDISSRYDSVYPGHACELCNTVYLGRAWLQCACPKFALLRHLISYEFFFLLACDFKCNIWVIVSVLSLISMTN